ncbi:MAG TPA: SCO family protein [Anaerolineaceae bacterium]
MSRRSLFILVIGILAGLGVAALIYFTQPYTLRGSVINPPPPAPDFTLLSADGKPFTLSAQKGKITLLFFGYTTCPDVCPSTLSQLSVIMVRLGKNADRVQVVFISVDPDRDTPEKIGKYAQSWYPTFAGLSGTQASLEPVWKAYGVYRNVHKAESATEYLVDHSAQTYLIDSQGRLRLTYAFGTPDDDIYNDLRFLLKEK